MSDLAALREENENLKKEVEALLQAKEIAKEKVRSAIQELVDENKRLKKKVTTLEAQVASLLAERNSLIQRLGDGTNGNGNFIPETNGDNSPASGRRVSISEESQPIERSYSSDDLNGRTVKKGGVEVSSLTGSMRAAPSRRPSSSKAAGLLGLTENKIMVELQHVPEALTIEEPGLLMMRLENDMLDIKGGVLEKLVERLYHATTPSQAPNYVPNFILTLRAFATPVDVASILIDAYSKQEDKDGRERVLKVFAKWLELQPEDFQMVGDRWDKFLKDSVLRLDGKEWVKDLQKAALVVSSRVAAPLLEGKEPPLTTSAASSPRSAKKEKLPKSIVPRSKGFTLDDLDAVEIARQLSMMDYELFQKIRPSEFNNLSWTRRTKETDAPNLLRMIHRFNEVSIWVQYVIVSADSARKRASYVEKFVKIGQQFLKQKNYNGIMQIVSALEGAAIHRLNKTFEKVKPGTKKKYIALHELMSGTSSYKMYRESLQDKEPPCIPYVGVHLTDLTAMCETHKNTLGPKYPDYLNMAKHMNVANLIKMLMRLQESSYQFYQVPIIRDWLEVQLNLFGATPEEKLFEMSLTIEPREE